MKPKEMGERGRVRARTQCLGGREGSSEPAEHQRLQLHLRGQRHGWPKSHGFRRHADLRRSPKGKPVVLLLWTLQALLSKAQRPDPGMEKPGTSDYFKTETFLVTKTGATRETSVAGSSWERLSTRSPMSSREGLC